MKSEDFWLYQWLDSYLATSPAQALKLLDERVPFQELKESAKEAADRKIAVDTDVGQAIVAGSALDLSGQLTCMHYDCLEGQVEDLFSSVWHYFDHIVVVGPSPTYITAMLARKGNEERVKRILSVYTRLLLHLRSIGANDVLRFTDRPDRFCLDCGNLLISEIGVNSPSPEAYQAFVDELASKLLREGKFKVLMMRGKRTVEFSHPLYLPEPRIREFSSRKSAAELTRDRHSIIRQMTDWTIGQLLGDISLSRRWQSPLGSTIKFHEELLRSGRHETTEADVALRLQLPVLTGVPAETLIKIRKDEAEHFEAFRNSLRQAISERLQTSGDKDAAVIAREITLDVIQPGLNEIRRKLGAARNVLVRKSAASIGIGAITTTCGILTANPLLVTTGVGAAMTALPASHKYFEERREVTLSDMYFMWQAQLHMREDAQIGHHIH